ncbi:MAG: cation:proton antiporter [Rhodocyclaceae bacterium]|nr:cation:proton antiporter [Rhodocyclaceae bacterium]
MSLLSSLLVLIVVARLFGKVFAKYNQPELIGEILAGVLLGPAVFNYIQPTPALAGISELAVFLIILSAGLEMRISDVLSAMRGRGLILALLSFAIPFLGGVAVAQVFELDVMRTVFFGLCVSITALPVAVKLMENMGILDTKIARYAIATAIVNDVAALFILGIVLNVPSQPSFALVASTLVGATGKLLLLAGGVLTFNWFLAFLDRRQFSVQVIPERLVQYFGPEALFGIVVLFVLAFGSVSEFLGFHFVIGAFFGALFLDQRHFLASRYEDLKTTLSSVTGGFLAPVFFAFLGLEFQIDALDNIEFPAAVLAVSIFTKVIAGWLGGRIVGMSLRESMGLGCILNGRGVMELVVASIAYQKGFIGDEMFSTLVLMGILTTFITPIMFGGALSKQRLITYRESGVA